MAKATRQNNTGDASRRAVLAGSIAAAATAALPVASRASVTDPHVAWWAELEALRAERRKLSDAADEEWERLPAELREPIRIVVGHYRDETGPQEERVSVPIYATSLEEIDQRAEQWIRAHRAISEELAAQTKALFDARREEYFRLMGERYAGQRASPWWPLYDRACQLEELEVELEERIVKTPARAPAGLAIKLRLVWEYNGDPALEPNRDEWGLDDESLWLALQDAEAIAGGKAVA